MENSGLCSCVFFSHCSKNSWSFLFFILNFFLFFINTLIVCVRPYYRKRSAVSVITASALNLEVYFAQLPTLFFHLSYLCHYRLTFNVAKRHSDQSVLNRLLCSVT